MLVDIVKLPNLVGTPIDRRMKLRVPDFSNDPHFDYVNSNDLCWPPHSIPQNNLIVGSSIPHHYREMYKGIYVSHDEKWVFEVVFSIENTQAIFWYVKMISSSQIRVAVSVKGIDKLKDGYTFTAALGTLIDPVHNDRVSDVSIDAVPPILSKESFYDYLDHLVRDCFSNHKFSEHNRPYEIIRDYEPSIYYGLIHGHFLRSPLKDLRSYHSGVDLRRSKWTLWQEIVHKQNVTECRIYINSEEFDDVIVKLISICPVNFSITSLISHAIDGISDVWLIREYHDPYHEILSGKNIVVDKYRQTIAIMLRSCLDAYWNVFGISKNERSVRSGRTPNLDYSTVTIVKNNYEEVAVIFEDKINDRHVCFYTSVSMVIMSTLAVGWYDSE